MLSQAVNLTALLAIAIGEHIRNWRSRYFYLREDGSLTGYKIKPETPQPGEPLNNFTVRGCQVLKTDKPAKSVGTKNPVLMIR